MALPVETPELGEDTQADPLLVNTFPDVPGDVNPVPPFAIEGGISAELNQFEFCGNKIPPLSKTGIEIKRTSITEYTIFIDLSI